MNYFQMNNLERERLNRSLYKQQQQLKQENTMKYPFTFDEVSNLNIRNYFVFDEMVSNIQSDCSSYLLDKEIKYNSYNENEIKYDIDSFIDNDNMPDLYTPLGKISGDKYNLIKNEFSNINSLNNEDENLNNNINTFMSKKRLRYFHLGFDFDEEPEIIIRKIPKKKINNNNKNFYFNNNNIKINRYSRESCHICLSRNHVDKAVCPKYKRCYKCLTYGHWGKDCNKILNNLCEKCGKSIHNKEDCLRANDNISNNDFVFEIMNNKLNCAFCDNGSHLICPFSIREKYILNVNKKFDNNNEVVKDYSKVLFCSYCGGNHLYKECPEINEFLFYNRIKEYKSINHI